MTSNVTGGRERAKHIGIRQHFAHEAAQLGHLRHYRASTADQPADAFTKGLQPKQRAARVARTLRHARGRDRRGRGSSRGGT